MVPQKKRIVFERTKLYEEVWTEPMVRVAAKYGMSNNGLKKICLKMDIPFPPNGYWRKLQTGFEVTKAPLPEEAKRDRYITSRLWSTPNGCNNIIELKNKTDHAEQTDMEDLIQTERAREIKHIHRVIREHKEAYALWEKDHLSVDLLRRNTQRRLSPGEPELWSFVSAKTLPRTYRFLDLLFRVIEKLGGCVLDICTVELYGEVINFKIEEMKTPAIFAAAKDNGLIDSEQYRGRKFDDSKRVYCPNGKLLFKIPEWYICKDSPTVLIEERILEIIEALIQEAKQKSTNH